MKHLFRIFLIVFGIVSTVKAADYQVGEFDYFVLSLSWHSAFCQQHQKKPECASQGLGDFSASYFTLHGLWPNRFNDRHHDYAFCGVGMAQREMDKKKRWCSLGEVFRTDDLEKKMPGVHSCLQMHEWIKHGTCSQMSIGEYYSVSLRLLDEFNETRFALFVKNAINKEVDKVKLLTVWQQEFPRAGKALVLECTKIAEKNYLSEVRIAVMKELGRNLSKSLLNKKIGKDRCGSRIYIDAAGF